MKTCMRYLAVVFAVAMIVCALSSVSAAFPDVENTHTHASAIETMTNLGIIGGYEDGTFRPDGLVRRDEMAKIVYATFTTYTDAGEGEIIFPDVPKNSWAKGYISWCAGKDIVGGYEDGTFRPEGNITYDEALKMVCAMLGYTDFSADLWPIDVRTKGLIDLKLGEKLDGIAGDAALTRAQIVQLVLNSLDKPMYSAPVEDDGTILGMLGMTTENTKQTIKDNIWGFTEIAAQIIGTENYGFIDADKGIKGTKTEDEGVIQVCLNYEENGVEKTEIQTLELAELGLNSYIGNSDGLIALYINLMKRAGSDDYVAAALKGVRKEGVAGGYADLTGLPESKIYVPDPTNAPNTKYARYGAKIDGINHYDEHFLNLRRLTYYDDFVLATNAHVDNSGKIINEFRISYSWNAGHNRWRENISFPITQGFDKYQAAIDADSDGWYDYLIVEYKELFRVKSVTTKTVELEYLYADQNATWRPVPDYTVPNDDPSAQPEVIPGLDLVFPRDNYVALSEIKVGQIVQGYQMGDTFTVTAEPTEVTGYAIKYDMVRDDTGSITYATSKVTLDSGVSVTFSYSNWKVWDSHSYTPTQIKNVITSLSPVVGKNDAGEYNYIKFQVIDGKAVWAEALTSEEAKATGDSDNKAILLYVTEPTEPQLNELTKENEIFYPAYLVIGGRTHLVNLNAKYAVDKFSAATVSQDGSPYRAGVKYEDETGINRIIYPNILVTYEIDSNGYYTLNTEAELFTDENQVEVVYNRNEQNEITGAIIEASDKTEISINKSTGIVTITVDGTELELDIVVDDDSIVYYPYTKTETGSHEHIDYYKGSEIPADFEKEFVTSNIYLRVEEETGLYVIDSLVIGEKFESATEETNYQKDARQHLFATEDSSAVRDGDKVRASYTFKNLFTYEDVTAVNKSKEYSFATEAEANKIYAWDADSKNYVEVTEGTCESFNDGEVITKILDKMSVIFTTSFADGLAIDDTVKIIAVTDKEKAETKVISFAELVDVFNTIEEYNALNEGVVGFTEASLDAKIGTYTEDKVQKIAYILIDWVEYDSELETYFFAGAER